MTPHAQAAWYPMTAITATQVQRLIWQVTALIRLTLGQLDTDDGT